MSETVVLLVEDDEDIRELVAGYLENEGYRVEEADSGRRALELTESLRPDLIVLDILLPDMSGFEVCVNVREKHNMPIVFMSCKDEAEDIISGLTLGGDDYVTKPFDPQVLVMRVKANLRRYRGTGGGRADIQPVRIPAEQLLQALTKREEEIMDLMALGLTNEEIAGRLSVSVGTVKWFNTQIFSKLDVKSRAQAIAKMHEIRNAGSF
ncbi:response regulator [Cohnella sp. CFH 77786]|uniref:response regulator n=1 Tax=Cohnella sp. CFH 77786 TaxID=2662265 RepID=UPI001C610FA2|nr:response regulator [Cohnella sp. CFH 77786]MBW5449417.1 response regulator [Cohnella sp. CFH 77786]